MTIHWKSAIGAGFVSVFGALAIGAAAGTPDGLTPAEETVCDAEPGNLYGLCTAYCEAMDCDAEDPHASDRACEAVLSNYERKSGGDLPPCLDDGDYETPR